MEKELLHKDYEEAACSLCGEKLTRYGNKLLKDGILCRNCAKLASPWLSSEDYKNLSIEDMKRHMAYREANKEKLEHFLSEKTVEGKYSLYLDETNGQFMISKRKDPIKANADVIPFSAIEEMNIIEEDYLDEEAGDIRFEMKLNGGEIGHLSFRVNEFPGLVKDTEEYEKAKQKAFEYLDALIQTDAFEEADEKEDLL